MKWNILVASMVLGLGLSTQSFGFDLLDRMLGGCDTGAACQKGCAQKGCDHGCAQKGGLGLFGGHHCAQKGDGKGCEPCQKADGKGHCAQRGGLFGGHHCAQKGDGKGCDPCQKADGKGHPCAQRGGLFGGHHCAQKGDGKGCEPCQKGDGKGHPCAQRGWLFGGHHCAQKGDGKGCEQKGHRMCGPSLLDRIFACRSCCDAKGGKGKDDCCDDKAKSLSVEAQDEEAPMPPAPVVDPSAFLRGQRSVVHASTALVN